MKKIFEILTGITIVICGIALLFLFLYYQDSCIYSIDSKYYNIETGEFYGSAHTSMTSKEFLFLENHYGDDKSKLGVMKINKENETWKLYK